MADVETRLANAADIANIAQLLSQTFYQYRGWRSPLTPLLRMGLCYDLTTRLQLPDPTKYQCWIAEITHPNYANLNMLVGTVEIGLRALSLPSLLLPPKAYISNLAVQQEYRQQGIGQLLLQRCETVAKRWDQTEIFLHVRDDNAIAQSLYRKLGYQVSAQRSPLDVQRCLLNKQL